jgi:AcrR family transcriptional regulator
LPGTPDINGANVCEQQQSVRGDSVCPAEAVDGGGKRHRDAANTRRLLLEAARRRFTRDGYRATTVRDVADDVGVNVALISRYFGSKEGLFEACIVATVRALSESAQEVTAVGQVAEAISRNLTGPAQAEGLPQALLLLLRSSGDERAEELRGGVLRAYGERLAAAAGWAPGQHDGDALLLRAQLVLATAVGIAVLRSSGRLEPLASASREELSRPLEELVDSILGGGSTP